MKVLTLLVTCCLCALSQGVPPNYAGKPNNSYGFYNTIIRPESLGIYDACYWFTIGTRANATIYPIVGMPVVASSYTTCGSGSHAHDLSCNDSRPQMVLSNAANPNGLFYSLVGVTDSTGCAKFAGIVPDTAGYDTMIVDNQAYTTTISTPTGLLILIYPAGELGVNFMIQDYGPEGTTYLSTDPTNPQPYDAYPYISTVNNLNYEPVDYSHGSAINNGLPQTITQVQNASQQYFNESETYVGYDDWIIMWRMSLPWGGEADNGVPMSTTSIMPGNWDSTTPYNAANQYGDEVEITNPSLSPYMPITNQVQTADAVNYAIEVFKKNGCPTGMYQPTFDPVNNQAPATQAFWITQQAVHFECAYTARPIGGR